MELKFFKSPIKANRIFSKTLVFIVLGIFFFNIQTVAAASDVTGQTAMVGNPRFMVVYMPLKKGDSHKDTRAVQEAGTAIQSVYLKNGFIVLDPEVTKKVYEEIELAGMIDTDVDAVAEFALKYQADLLLLYDIQVSAKKGGKSAHFGGFNFTINLKSVSSATGDLIATKKGSLYVKTDKKTATTFDSPVVVTTARNVSAAVSKSLLKDSRTYFSRAVRFDVWLNNFSEEEIYLFMDLLEQINDFVSFDVRNQAPENFQLDVLYKGKKFTLQRQIYKILKKHEITFTTQQSKGNRLLLIRD